MYLSRHSKLFIWEMSGFVVLILLGFLFHFAYDWSNFNHVVGALAPVNESVWEHLKLGYLGLWVFSLVEFSFIKNKARNYFAAKAAGLLALELIIVIGVYIYKLFIGRHILFIDISLYIVGCIACQIIAFKIMSSEKLSVLSILLGLVFIIVLGFFFIYFTFNTPRLPIFLDSRTGTYGIKKIK